MTPHLLTLPQEIRTMILLNLFRSPTRYIALFASTSAQSTKNFLLKIRPHDPNKSKSYVSARTISLALLRTCKQLYAESRDLVWRENNVTFQFSRPILVDNTRRALSRMQKSAHIIGKHLRHVELCLFLLCNTNAETALPALEFLKNSAGSGGLKSVTLRNVSVGREDGWNLCEQLYLRRFQSEEDEAFFHDALLDAGGSEGYLKDVGKKIFFDVDFECTHMDFHTLAWWRAVGVLEVPKKIRKLHDAFGGELWVNGGLWMRDGVEVEGMKLQPLKRVRRAG
ncbi:hypothetical protein IFR05_016153 [Cadophora sp. M221]|nr:hypothetical protein IFR05_016153 [Cadophora sp. M221]